MVPYFGWLPHTTIFKHRLKYNREFDKHTQRVHNLINDVCRTGRWPKKPELQFRVFRIGDDQRWGGGDTTPRPFSHSQNIIIVIHDNGAAFVFFFFFFVRRFRGGVWSASGFAIRFLEVEDGWPRIISNKKMSHQVNIGRVRYSSALLSNQSVDQIERERESIARKWVGQRWPLANTIQYPIRDGFDGELMMLLWNRAGFGHGFSIISLFVRKISEVGTGGGVNS